MKRSLVAAALLSLATAAFAERESFRYEEPERAPWREAAVQLPPMPKEDRLLEFAVGASTTRSRYFVDRDSITVGEDQVVRYTLVIRTAGGATNITFEGLRCATRESKVYALGQADATWAELRAPAWRGLTGGSNESPRAVLYSNFLCPNRTAARDAAAAVQALERGERQRTGADLLRSD